MCLPSLKTDEISELEAEWQYQLPSPPKAFRDSSPTNFTDMTNYDTVTFNGLSTESVVTPPPVFDKNEFKDSPSENETISEVDASESKILTSKYLSLENLEKRKSLVLERELSSLKAAQDDVSDKSSTDSLRNTKANLINEVEEVIHNRNSKTSTLSRSNSQMQDKILYAASESVLPNFKITTYDQPKSKINIFEDDTIRSNVDKKYTHSQKRNSMADINVFYQTNNKNESTFLANKRNSLGSVSTENLHSLKKINSFDDDVFKKPQEVSKYNMFSKLEKQNGESVLRSESFTQKNGWIRSNPVKRSKSQVSLEKYAEDIRLSKNNDKLQKSNSMWNVSGLQSLEVNIFYLTGILCFLYFSLHSFFKDLRQIQTFLKVCCF